MKAAFFIALRFDAYLKGMVGIFGIDSLVRYVGGLLQIVTSVTVFGQFAGFLSALNPRLKEYFYLTELKSTPNDGKKIKKIENIVFENVSFCYDDAMPNVLNQISIQIPIGERIAIVGENGSGKTTFIKLLCGLHPLNEGRILVNGEDIRSYDESEYRKMFSVIFQDFNLFSFPLGENIVGNQSYDDESVFKVLRKVGFSNRLERMHKGLESYLYRDCDPNGIEISGGEAQKLSLARALYKNAPVIVLDEPTAALDPFAEQEFYLKFDELIGDKTVLYISHRLSSCYFCNKIAVFDQGRLVQFGSHEELLADNKGKYFELWNAQAKYYV